MRHTVQHDEVSNLPSKGRLLASVSLSLVSVLNGLGGRSSVSLSPVPRDDNGKLRGLSGESVETSQRSTANNDPDRLSRRRLERALFLYGLRVFARHTRLIGSNRLLLCRPPNRVLEKRKREQSCHQSTREDLRQKLGKHCAVWYQSSLRPTRRT